MDEETQKIIQEQIKNLPNDVREAIVAVDYSTKLQEITKRQRLLIDQAAKLEMETTLVMIGLEPLADFIENIKRELVVNELRAKDIAMDVSEHIFKPIRTSLQTMNTVAEEEDAGPNAEEPVAPKFTNTNEIGLNRDQILNEIENPAIIAGGDRSIQMSSEVKTTELEVRPTQELETLPGEGVKDITKVAETNVFEAKMTSPTISTQQIINKKPETKLPELNTSTETEKKRPTSGTDPYREPLM
jgi:hypothetical protein